MPPHPDSLPDLTGKVYIVTGATSGIGYHTVARLAQHGAHVYLCARTAEKGKTALETLRTVYPCTPMKLSVLTMDHESLSTVTAAASDFLSKEPALHGLVNNAGTIAMAPRTTADGHELMWQINYLAHWLLTAKLMPVLLRTSKTCAAGSVRVVNLASNAYTMGPKGGIRFDELGLRDSGWMAQYGQSKLATILHAKTLDRRYGPEARSEEGEVWTAAVHPGVVRSETTMGGGDMPWYMNVGLRVFRLLGWMADTDTGTWTSLFCAASEEMRREDSGGYFQEAAEAGPGNEYAESETLAEELESWTREVMEREGWLG